MTPRRTATRDALTALATVAFGAFVLAALGSLWLAQTLTDPIDRLSGEIAMMTAARDLRRPLHPTGTSRELDALAGAFNELIQGLTTAEADTRAAYLGAIRALAATLDARDPYTAGHSERVSALSVLIGRQMGLDAAELDVLRLGALLHDIGKIGLSDAILRKPGPLTAEEYDQLKRHPGQGRGSSARSLPRASHPIASASLRPTAAASVRLHATRSRSLARLFSRRCLRRDHQRAAYRPPAGRGAIADSGAAAE